MNLEPFSPGISTSVFRPAAFQPARHLALIARVGFSCIELNCYQGEKDFDWRSRRALRELARVSEHTGVAVSSVHVPGQYPRTHVDGAMGREYVDTTKAFCHIAAELGAGVVVIHALKARHKGPTEWDELMERLLEELAEHVQPLPVTLGLENLTWRVVPSEDLALVGRHDAASMGFVLDSGHAHLFGELDAYLAGCGQRLCGVHIHDNGRTKDEHLLPGEGTIDWEWFMNGLVRTGYRGPLMLEVNNVNARRGLSRYLADCMRSAKILQGYLPGELKRTG